MWRESALPLTGRCQCGAVRYEIGALPRAVYVCHCSQCRRQSASAFGISVLIGPEDVRLLRGNPSLFSKRTDRGGRKEGYFCADCGTRLWHISSDDPETVSVKGGSLDEPPDLSAVPHIWTSMKLPGVIIPPGAEQFREEPPGS